MSLSVAAPSCPFEAAKEKFRKGLKDESLYNDLLKTTSFDAAWVEVEKIQSSQHAQRRLRHMSKIKPFLEKLKLYTPVVEVFVQAKPDMMALIWGPIRLLIVCTDNIVKCADAILDVMASVGQALPQFDIARRIFNNDERLKELMGLFYGDILEIFAVCLKFFTSSRAKIFFESLWPQQKDKIDKVVTDVARHTSMIRNEITIEHIREEYEFRVKSLTHFDEEAEFRQVQKFLSLKLLVAPSLPFATLENKLHTSVAGTASWFLDDQTIQKWLDPLNASMSWLWVNGIPGAGKTILSAMIIDHVRALKLPCVFFFASYAREKDAQVLSILQSLLFQLADVSTDVRSAILHNDHDKIQKDSHFVSELFRDCLQITGPTYIVIDGMDEMERTERQILLERMELWKDCLNAKALISSRPEADIAQKLQDLSTVVRIDKRNQKSIEMYVHYQINKWIRTQNMDKEIKEKIQSLLARVAKNAKGMFLYARLVIYYVKSCSSIEEIEGELAVLPESLDEAYERIFNRIHALDPVSRKKATQILGWISCAPVPMTVLELEQVVAIVPCPEDGFKAAPSVVFGNNFAKLCGPIIEVVDDKV